MNDRGLTERFLYGFFMLIMLKFVKWGYLDSAMADYVAAGGVTAVLGAYSWWRNSPAALLDRAGATLPDNAKIVLAPAPSSTQEDKEVLKDLSANTGPRVTTTAT